jgi:uncharacterized membrane protein YeaQ/YmgE (transglycosylase-associated protein family)
MANEPTTLRSASSIREAREQRLISRYGGFDWVATFLGFAVAIFFALIFLGIVGAVVGTVGFQLHAQVPKVGSALTGTTEKLGVGALIGSLVAAFLAYLLGGYAAGRLARFQGVLNGIGVVLWTVAIGIILGIIGAILGNKFDVAKQLHLHIDTTTLTAGGLISLVITVIVLLVAASLGGMLGERYHRGIDREAGIR